MSKEQTPMEELEKELKSRGIYLPTIFKKAKQKEQKHTQAKVLEALEREVTKTHLEQNIITQKYIVRDMQHEPSDLVMDILKEQAKEYYETEVKPKYE